MAKLALFLPVGAKDHAQFRSDPAQNPGSKQPLSVRRSSAQPSPPPKLALFFMSYERSASDRLKEPIQRKGVFAETWMLKAVAKLASFFSTEIVSVRAGPSET